MKKCAYLFIIILIIFYFLLRPKDAFYASSNGILLWFEQILPTLLPFSILSNIVLSSNIFHSINTMLYKIGIHFKKISFEEWFIIFCGFLFGFPIGSKLTADLCSRNMISERRAQILCAFTNNLSPVFVSSFVCSTQFNHPEWIIPTYCLLYGPPFVIGICSLLKNHDNNPCYDDKKKASRFRIDMKILDAGILNGFETLIKLCGYIVLFSIIVDIFRKCTFLPSIIQILVMGNIEVTNGIAILSEYSCDITLKYLLMIQFLAFGGLSGIAQTGSMLLPTKLSLKKYVKWKLLFVICSSIIPLFLLLKS